VIFYANFFTKKSIVMTVNIQAVHFDADVKLVNYVKAKLEKLNTFHDRITKVEVFLKLDNIVHNIKDKIAEIRVKVPKQEFFVKCSSKSFESSFDDAMESLINQIKRKKEKLAA
jgi:putative sigma-54 modulation protein